ncbi:exosome complex exonuclease [Babesia ovata]|uniref:Exosome complex exonuclease n=1 Tax=Babesia ovata TaxID=189622 RepID=A0A2H6K9F8_9APIC|nr:exosome complex exonuclease [Babesia ovata]GBE59621.1 exosome complex exonuclease [Babesia ovata]
MVKIEYISVEGLRVDGRRPAEVRNIEILCGPECGVDVGNYDGVSQVTQGLTKAQAFVKGPTDVGRNKQRSQLETSDSPVEIQCEVVMPCEKRATGNKMDHQSADIAQTVIATFERIVLSHFYKNSVIHIFVNVLENDGDPNQLELNASIMELTLATSVSKEEIIYIDLKSKHAIKSVEEIILNTIQASKQFSILAKTKLKKYARDYLELNSAVHV